MTKITTIVPDSPPCLFAALRWRRVGRQLWPRDARQHLLPSGLERGRRGEEEEENQGKKEGEEEQAKEENRGLGGWAREEDQEERI